MELKKFQRALVLFLALAVVLAALPASAQAAPVERSRKDCAGYHTVKSGETLEKIARRYEMKWRAIAEANRIEEPYQLYVGQSLCIPKSDKNVSSKGKVPKVVAGDFRVILLTNSIQIRTTDFPTRNSFYVKVDDARVEGFNWTKIGILRIKKRGSVTAEFLLPKEMKGKSLNVCLKNGTTDAVACRLVYR